MSLIARIQLGVVKLLLLGVAVTLFVVSTWLTILLWGGLDNIQPVAYAAAAINACLYLVPAAIKLSQPSPTERRIAWVGVGLVLAVSVVATVGQLQDIFEVDYTAEIQNNRELELANDLADTNAALTLDLKNDRHLTAARRQVAVSVAQQEHRKNLVITAGEDRQLTRFIMTTAEDVGAPVSAVRSVMFYIMAILLDGCGILAISMVCGGGRSPTVPHGVPQRSPPIPPAGNATGKTVDLSPRIPPRSPVVPRPVPPRSQIGGTPIPIRGNAGNAKGENDRGIPLAFPAIRDAILTLSPGGNASTKWVRTQTGIKSTKTISAAMKQLADDGLIEKNTQNRYVRTTKI